MSYQICFRGNGAVDERTTSQLGTRALGRSLSVTVKLSLGMAVTSGSVLGGSVDCYALFLHTRWNCRQMLLIIY